MQPKPIEVSVTGQLPDLGHDTLALELGDIGWRDGARYWVDRGKFLFWNGAYWTVEDRMQSFTFVRAFLRMKAIQIKEWAIQQAQTITDEKGVDQILKWADRTAKELANKATVNAVRDMVRSNGGMPVTTDQLDTDPWLVGAPSGTIDLRTGIYRISDPADLITKSVAVNPAPPGSHAPVWNSFLRTVMDGDDDLVKFLQRLFGYALTGLVTEHKFAFFYGTGRNGKGTFLNTILDIMSSYARKAPASMFLETKTPEHVTELAGLVGKRFVFGSEIPKGAFWNEVLVKDITGGDMLSARFMRQDFFDYFPQFLLAIAGNAKPAIRGVDPAIRERMMLVPFTVYIEKANRDPKLPEKLKQEWPMILRWLIDGCLEWQRIGLSEPEAVTKATEGYMDAEDIVGQFITERCVVDWNDKRCGVRKDEMFTAYNAWRTRQGLKPLVNMQIVKELESKGFYEKRMRIGGMTKTDNPVFCFRGIKINREPPTYFPPLPTTLPNGLPVVMPPGVKKTQ
nr:phage/plasmid primase, P4 family [Ruegeria arenilitoris]